jgi:CubicO group peptidase (beta-lactamase class C family)
MTLLDPTAAGDLLAAHHVPGLSMATSSGTSAPVSMASGTRDRLSGAPVDAATVFEAASLTKPVFAFTVMKLVQDGILSLDQPLAQYLPHYMSHDPAAAPITARHVLSHTAGLPNWRSDAYPLRTYFPPGERFSYSGEGYVYLQKAIEQLCGEPLERIAERMVFAPLAMTNSSLVWRDEFLAHHAVPHTSAGQRFDDGFAGKRFTAANAAGSLYTTASDYLRFLQAVLRKPDLDAWLAPCANVPRDSLTHLDSSVALSIRPDVAWALGWGIETDTRCFFHWGDQRGYKAFIIASPDGRAFVALTNGDAGLSFMSKLLAPVFPGPRPSLLWLGYEP